MTRTYYFRRKTGTLWRLKLKKPLTPGYHISVYDENKVHEQLCMVEQISNKVILIFPDTAKFCWIYEEGV